jgi:hypothetical protein
VTWYAVVAFTAYAAFLIWQVTLCVENASRRLVAIAIPYLLVKLFILIVALAYWDPGFCFPLNDEVGRPVLWLGACILFSEAALFLKPAFLMPDPEYDNLILAVTLLGTVILPGGVLFFAASVVLGHRCAI